MFCGKCGTQVADDANHCTNCGATLAPPPPTGSQGFTYSGSTTPSPPAVGAPTAQPLYAPQPTGGQSPYQAPPAARACGHCGSMMSTSAVACPNCGTMASGLPPARNKTAAILLHVFLGPWAWIYTWQRDKGKFFLGMVVPGVCLIALIALAAGSHQVVNCDATGFCTTTSTNAGGIVSFVLLWILTGFAFWLWGLIAACVRTNYWYAAYPQA